MSNFTGKNVTGHYCRINGLETSAIISDRIFDGAERRDKRNFLSDTLPEILNQPWEEGRRISFSKGWIEKEEKKEPSYWAMIVGNVRHEFRRLRTDEEKRTWLLRQTILRRFPKGEEFLNL